ncbi:uncharacterized protein B0H18DRAFT_51524 [Fomitopsis serialis]|uniref:uncharacterized protein n=1 Tax=Fomitopsis serialis TaxID=139415 RepID=UPI002007B45B|nr:uncharacterized protein B0H18DRAFT_51524 [Neoantrodia serialis]KAH9932241.1 hypothetical protein B0H18DRAFT_51524 [Neoantrodia serialis]
MENIMHRDVSERNILLFSYRTIKGKIRVIGLLIDWDLCKHKDYLDTAMSPGRSGTWPFMSARLLRDPGKMHEVADDLESIVHILRLTCLRFYKHNMSDVPDELRSHVIQVYEAQEIVNGKAVGGAEKHNHMLQGYLGAILVDSETPLAKLLSNLADICKKHYLVVEPPKANPAQATAVAPPADEDEMATELETIASHRSRWPLQDTGETRQDQVEVPKSTSSRPPSPLDNHEAIMRAFYDALNTRPTDKWRSPVKCSDQFATFKDSPLIQSTIERSSQQSSGSKRKLEIGSVDLAKPGPSKRAKATTTGGLQSLPEEEPAAAAQDKEVD